MVKRCRKGDELKVVPAILTYNQFATKRADLFQQTYASIKAAGVEPIVVSNGSNDGTDKVVRALPKGIVEDSNPKMWWGCTVAIVAALDEGADVVMFSADDLTYHDGWLPKLQAWWTHAPDDVVLAGGFLEGEFPWNEPSGVIDAGGVRGLVRPSVPSATWTFRARDWPLIRDPETLTVHQQSPGEDHATCQRLLANGYRLAQLDLAEHSGVKVSAWKNESWKYEKPLDRAKWGFD